MVFNKAIKITFIPDGMGTIFIKKIIRICTKAVFTAKHHNKKKNILSIRINIIEPTGCSLFRKIYMYNLFENKHICLKQKYSWQKHY